MVIITSRLMVFLNHCCIHTVLVFKLTPYYLNCVCVLFLTTSDPLHFAFLAVLENCCVPLPLSHELAVNTGEEAVPGCHSPLGGFLSALSD